MAAGAVEGSAGRAEAAATVAGSAADAVAVASAVQRASPVSSPSRSDETIELDSATSFAEVGEQGYRRLPSEELRLSDQVERLVESPRYDLLLHAGWRQPGLEREAAIPLWIRGGRIFGQEYTSIDERIPLLESRQKSLQNAAAIGQNSFEFDEQTLAVKRR